MKFGISPFGIYRNQKNDPRGSKTNGLQNYDDLYADILLWVKNGWLDYNVPQLYWEMGHKAADYTELIRWWSNHASERPLFIGEDVQRTVKAADPQNQKSHQLPAKMQLHQENKGVQGTVLWYAKVAVDNIGNYGTSLRNVYWRYPALQPLMPHLDNKAPGKVRKLKVFDVGNQQVLMWTAPKFKDWNDEAIKYVVYCFKRGEDLNTDDPSHIVAITKETFYEIPTTMEQGRYVYLVTALDRLQNESKTVKKNVKL